MTSAEAKIAERWRIWLRLVLLLVPALAFWLWAVRDVESVAPWAWRGGWILPVPSLTFMFLAAGGLLGLLSGVAWLLHTTPAGARVLPAALSVTIVGIFALDIRIGQAILSPVPIVPWAFGLDLLAVAALIATLWRARRSVWWALLYAVHPLVLLGAPGSWRLSAAVLGVLVLLEVQRVFAVRQAKTGAGKWRHFASVFTAPGMIGVIAAAWWINGAVPAEQHSPGVMVVLASALSWGRVGPEMAGTVCAVIGPVVLAALVLAGTLQRWKLPVALMHAALAYALCAPSFSLPVAALPLALAMVRWNRAAWIFGMTAMAFAAVAAFGEPGVSPGLPDWLSLFVWIPLVVTELDELFRNRLGGGVAISTQPSLSVSSPP